MNIVLTGGGTAGHAMINQVLANMMQKGDGDTILYIGSYHGAERALMERTEGILYYPISTGKLRRYFSLKNFTDFFRVWWGIAQAYQILRREEANVVFSGGGFVSLPVVIAAWLLKIPVLIRETDLTMGLANRICARFAQKVFTTFPHTPLRLKKTPCECTGLIVRPELLPNAVPEARVHFRPTVLVMGGSLGSEVINHTIWDNIQSLSKLFCINHLCGKGQTKPHIYAPEYIQRDYTSNMSRLYAQADVVVTRCGSNAMSECLALGKRMVCIPISTRFSRGEQLSNAKYAAKNGCALILEEENLSGKALESAIWEVLHLPMKQDCILSKDALDENCQRLLRTIYAAAEAHFERQMIKKVRSNQIDFTRLSQLEFQRFSEITDEYYP